MSKAGMAGAAVGVGGTGAAGIYGAHHMGWFGGSGKDGEKHGKLYVAKNWTDLEKANGGCIDHSFTGWSMDPNWTSVDGNIMTSSSSASSTDTGGCLVFNWEKKNLDKGGVGSGFRLVWTLSRGSAGFVVHLSGTVKENNQMEFDDVAFAMEKKGEKWWATKYLRASGKIMTDLKTLFPKVDKDKVFEKGDLENDYWGFLDDQGDKVKGGKSYGNGRRKWVGGSSDALKAWSSNLGEWWKKLFDEDLDMTKVIEGIKGKWEKY